MPKSHPRRNAVRGKNGRFRKVFAAKPAIFIEILKMAVEKSSKGKGKSDDDDDERSSIPEKSAYRKTNGSEKINFISA